MNLTNMHLMAIPVSAASWILNFSKTNKERDLKNAEYLVQIAEEANELSNVWENVAATILRDGTAEAEIGSIWMKLVERPEWTIYSKNIPRSRLELFYDKLSSVLGKSQKTEADFLVCKIGAVLQKRKLTAEIVEEELKRIKDAKLFDKSIILRDEMSIIDSILIVKKESAALNSLANEYKARIQ
jgi:hypothetical protein